MQERKGVVTMKGNPLTLVGPELKVGDKAPDFVVVDTAMAPKSLKDYEGKIKVLSVTPSLDTPVCDLQATWFNEDTAELGDVYVLNVSMDLPFALKRYCAAKGFDKVATLSDHREASFGTAYGVLLKELQSLCLDVKILGEDGEEVDLKDDDDDDSIYGAGGKALPDDEITMDDDLPNGKDVDADEAAEAGFEIQDEDNVFGLLNDSYTMDSDDSENV